MSYHQRKWEEALPGKVCMMLGSVSSDSDLETISMLMGHSTQEHAECRHAELVLRQQANTFKPGAHHEQTDILRII